MTIKTEKEFNDQVSYLAENFHGRLDHLAKAIGYMVLGRYFGWRVIRLISTRPEWAFMTKQFGDPKLYMEEEEPQAHRSYGFQMVKALDNFWDVVNGKQHLPTVDRRTV